MVCAVFSLVWSSPYPAHFVCVTSVSGHAQAAPRPRKDQPMDKQAQNIQEAFLNTARKDKTFLTIYLMSGVKLSGRIRSFDKYSVVLETNNQEQLIFKHAISTVVMSKPYHGGSHGGSSHSHSSGHSSAGSGQAAGASPGAPGPPVDSEN